jgi:LysM repeat protein
MERASFRLRIRLIVVTALAILALALPTAAFAAPAESASYHGGSGCSAFHIVRPGQTLSGIAVAYGVSVQALMQANNIWNPNHIFAGQKLCIPGGWGPPGGSGCVAYHTARYGETLAGIARAYGVSTWALMQANNISNPNRIYAGQTLCIPGGSGWPEQPPPQPPSGCFDWYVVKRGDTLSQIAVWYGTTVHALMRLNGISNPNHIYVGQYLKVPVNCGQPKPPPPPPPCHPHPSCPPPPPQPPPCHPHPSCPPPQPEPTGYWYGAFWSNPDFSGSPAVTMPSPQIAFDWGTNPPAPGMPNQNWSAQWTRTEYVKGGTYRIYATTDDGVRVFVDNQLVIDGWRVQPATSYFGDVALSEGYHDFRVEYFQASGVALIYVNYSRLN